jgi:hypothetical protein
MKATLDVLPSIANWELGGIGNLVRQKPENCAVPSEVKSATQVMDCVPGNQGQLIQGSSEFWDFVHHELSTVRVILDCGSATILQSDVSRCKLRDVFLGPINLEAGVSVKCTHGTR